VKQDGRYMRARLSWRAPSAIAFSFGLVFVSIAAPAWATSNTYEVTATIPIPGPPWAVAVDSTLGYLFVVVGNPSGTGANVEVLNESTNSVVSTIPLQFMRRLRSIQPDTSSTRRAIARSR
jgi:hypothetical protein